MSGTSLEAQNPMIVLCLPGITVESRRRTAGLLGSTAKDG